jgi:type IV secretory pathway VirB4 component
MLRLDKVIKPWKESASLNDHINLYGFWNETTFLTKSGDVGMVLSIPGVDYESLDHAEQEYAVKRLEAALKAFGPGFHVYQYLFKSNRPDIPFASMTTRLWKPPSNSGGSSLRRSATISIRSKSSMHRP